MLSFRVSHDPHIRKMFELSYMKMLNDSCNIFSPSDPRLHMLQQNLFCTFYYYFSSPLHASSLWTTPSGLQCPPGRKAVWGVAPAACALYGCSATSGQWPWLALGLRPLSEAGPQLNWAAAVQMNLGEKSGKEEKAVEKWWIRRMQKSKKAGKTQDEANLTLSW